MKSTILLPVFLIAIITVVSVTSGFSPKNDDEPWTPKQLLDPAELAKMINDPNAKQPIIFSIGFGAYIENSIDIGPVKEKENMARLKVELKKIPKETNIVIYCGCCPFEHCPNIRPAFQLLNKLKFSNQKLLNLPKNIKADWIDKGYPKNN